MRVADEILDRFADPERGGFFSTAADHEPLIARRKELEDAPIPSGSSAAAFGLLRLARLTGEARYEDAALGVIRLLHTLAPQHPNAFGHLLQAIDFHLADVREVALVGPDREPLERVVREAFRPHLVLAGGEPDGVPLLEGRAPVEGRAAAYVCEHFACLRPGHRAGRAAGPVGARLIETVRAAVPSPEPPFRLSPLTSPMSKLLTLPTGRRAKWIVAAVWLLAIVRGLRRQPPRQVRRRGEQRVDLLPAERRRVDQGARGHGGAAGRRAGGARRRLPPRGRADARPTASRSRPIARSSTRRWRSTRRSTRSASRSSPRAEDAALLIGNITGDGESETILDPIDEMRELVSDPGGGLEVKVTGPAGFAADAIKVFESINGTLLLAAVGIVFFLLILIYRSPLFFWIPLIAVGFAEIATRAVGYGLTELGVTVNGQSSSILSVLVLGAGTDYALLLVSRYREELRKHEDKHEAIALAMRTAGPAIAASGCTVIAALLCLSLAKVEGTAGLGPIGALGIAVAMISMLTLLPAMLAITGRRAFWRPAIFGWSNGIPHFGDEGADEMHGTWRRVGERVAVRPRRVWIGTSALLVVMALGLLTLDTGLTQSDAYREEVESIEGQELLAQSFPAGASAATEILVPRTPTWQRSRAPPRASRAWPRYARPARAPAACCSTPSSSPTPTRPRPTT